MDKYKEIFLQNKANEKINEETIEFTKEYLPFYSDVNNNNLAYLFAYFHYKLNSLFQFMNDKTNVNHHYNADASRELISLISSQKQLSRELKSSEYAFTINENYSTTMDICNNFLEGSGGSAIPDDFKQIDIIEAMPIFHIVKKQAPIDTNIIFDEVHIHTQWKKALERKITDPEGAITTARTLIESILKYILDEKNIKYNENSDLSEIYKEVAKSLNLAPEQHQEQIFKQILGGANGIISGLGSLRNKLGDAHGKSKTNVKPKERHSELAVNLAGTMAIFLYKTYKEEMGNNG